MTDVLSFHVISSFTAAPVGSTVRFWADRLGIPVELSHAAYGQVFQELQQYGHGAGPGGAAVAVLLRMEDLVPPDAHDLAAAVGRELAAALTATARRSPAVTFLLAVCPASPALGDDPRRRQMVDAATRVLREESGVVANIGLIEPEDVLGRYRVARVDDSYADGLGKVPYTPEYFAALGTAMMRRLYRIMAPEPKVVVVDGDNSLWDGILGEDGVSGIRVGLARQELQEFLIGQRRSGRLLCLCSKNEPADIEAAMSTVPGMRLTPEDFVEVRANWDPKSKNIADLAQQLDLALDAFVFIDDSPTECAEMRSHCPDVTTLQLPPDAPRALQALRHYWPLDVGNVTGEASRRTALYHQDRRRREARLDWPLSLAEFIDSLELEVTIRPADAADHTRMADLMRRTTQFNLSRERYGVAEIEALPDATTRLVVDVRDRFGSYGTVGLMMLSAACGSLEVTTFLLSCRVLGRGVEHRMLAHVGLMAVNQGLDDVQLRYTTTPRNLPARRFLDDVAVLRGEAADAGLIYAIRAQDAAGLRYAPDGPAIPEPAPAPEQTLAATGTAGPPRWDRRLPAWDDLGLITTELTTAERVRKAVGAAWADAGNLGDRADDERVVIQIWAQILEIPAGDVNGDFRALGGGSLEIVALLAQVYEAFRVEIPVDMLLDQAFTVTDLVEMIRLLRACGEAQTAGDIPWVE